MISLNNKEITQIYRDDSLVEYIYKGDRSIYDCMIDYVLNDDGTCYVNRAGPTYVARQENIEYLYIPNKICKNSRIYEVTKVGTRGGDNNKFRTLKKALIGAPTDESGKMAIVDYGFEDRTSLEEVMITDSVFSIGFGAFLGCNKIARMTLPPCASRLDRIFGNQVDTSTGEWVPQSLKTVTIHSNRETFKRLQGRFFYKCRYIETVNIDIKNLEGIGDTAFEGCSNLINITLPDNTHYIEIAAFADCTNLKTITLPTQLQNIDDQVFEGCTSLAKIIMKPLTPPTLGLLVFPDNVGEILVPKGSLAAYQAAPTWESYKSKLKEIQ